MIIYGMNSPHVAKVRAVLDIKGVEYQSVSVDLKNKSDEFLKISQTGKIPVIDDNGQKITDSWKIIEYINEKYPQNNLLPEKIEDKVIVYNITSLVDDIFESLRELYMKKFGMIELSEEKEDIILKKINQKLEIISHQLGDKKFLVGDTLTVGDIYISIIGYITTQKFDIESGISDWSENFYKEYIPNAFPKSGEKAIKNI